MLLIFVTSLVKFKKAHLHKILDVIFRAFYLYSHGKYASSLYGFFLFELTCMASKRNSLTSMAFRPFLPFDGVNSRVK